MLLSPIAEALHSSCPIAILVDADAHGLDILSVYQYGSKGMRFTAEAEGLALGKRATWIGVKATEWSA
jgi:meiotic recombination protein SPO11